MLKAASSPVMRLPGIVARMLRPLPLLPLEPVLQGLINGIIKRHPDLFERFGDYGGRCIGIDPSDLPFAILLSPQREAIRLQVVRELEHGETHARIRGPILALMGLVDGSYDGDALFFSRDITIEGDIEAALALRNAIDGAQVDLLREMVAWTGPLAAPLHHAARSWPARCMAMLPRQ